MAADSKSVIPMLGNVRWDEKSFQTEVTGNEARAVVERHSVGGHSADARVLIERQPLGAGLMGDRLQRSVDTGMDNRNIARRHQIEKSIPISDRYGMETSGIGERFHAVNDRQYLETCSMAEGLIAEQRYHADSRILRERCPIDSRSLAMESRLGRERYPVIRDRQIESRPGEEGARAMLEGEIQHMGDRYMEVTSGGDMCAVDPRYPVGMRHAVEPRSLNERHPIDSRERYPLESRVLVERFAVDPRASGDRYTIETAAVGERVVWTEEANNVR